jgi:hypothetical protein
MLRVQILKTFNHTVTYKLYFDSVGMEFHSALAQLTWSLIHMDSVDRQSASESTQLEEDKLGQWVLKRAYYIISHVEREMIQKK